MIPHSARAVPLGPPGLFSSAGLDGKWSRGFLPAKLGETHQHRHLAGAPQAVGDGRDQPAVQHEPQHRARDIRRVQFPARHPFGGGQAPELECDVDHACVDGLAVLASGR